MTGHRGLIKLRRMTEDLILYFKQVLGVNEVLAPAIGPEVKTSEVPNEKRISVVLFIDDKPWTQSVTDLFQKMRLAMKLTENQIQVLFLDQIAGPIQKADLQLRALSATAVVNFSHQSLEGLPADIQFRTISPSRLIENPAQKKEVWAELQRVMVALQISEVSKNSNHK